VRALRIEHPDEVLRFEGFLPQKTAKVRVPVSVSISYVERGFIVAAAMMLGRNEIPM